jgi:hypothetical protein
MITSYVTYQNSQNQHWSFSIKRCILSNNNHSMCVCMKLFSTSNANIANHEWAWKHAMVVKDCCHKYYFLKLLVFKLLPSKYEKGFFANGIWNKIVQNPKSKIVKKNLTLKFILNKYSNEKSIIVTIYSKVKIYFKNYSNDYQIWWSTQSYITYEFNIPF